MEASVQDLSGTNSSTTAMKQGWEACQPLLKSREGVPAVMSYFRDNQNQKQLNRLVKEAAKAQEDASNPTT